MKQYSGLTVVLGITAGFAIGLSSRDDFEWWRYFIVAVIIGAFMRQFSLETKRSH